MSWVAVAVAGAAVVGGAVSANASRSAANTQTNAAKNANATQLAMFNTIQANQQPFMQTGYGANNLLAYYMGITPQTASGGAPGSEITAGAGQFKPSELIRLHQQGLSTNDILRLGTIKGTTKASDYQALLNAGFTAQDLNALQTGQALPETAGAAGNTAGAVNGGPKTGMGDYVPTPQGGVDRRVTVGQGMSPNGAPLPGGVGIDQSGQATAPGDFGMLTRGFSPSDFLAGIDPGYGWRMQQGAQAVQNSAAAGSGSLSGNALKDLMSYGQGAASQEYQNAFDRYQTQTGNIYQRLLGLTTLGQNAAAGVGQQGMTAAGNIGANIVGAGNAQAAGQIGVANAINSGIGGITGAVMYNQDPQAYRALLGGR